MTELISAFSTLLFIAALTVNGILAFIVLKNDTNSATNRLFALLAVTLSLWLIAMNSASTFLSTPQNAVLTAKTTIFLATPLTLVFFFFGHTFPKKKLTLSKGKRWLSYGCTAIVMLIAASPFSFTGATKSNGIYHAEPGPGMIPFAILTTTFSALSVFFLLRGVKSSTKQEHKQFQYVLLGLFLMSALITGTIMFPVLLTNNQTFVPLAPLYALIFLGMTAYAIVKHKLFDIKILATQVFVAILSIIFFARLFTTNTRPEFIFELLIFIATIFFGYLLIKSVTKEVEQRKELAKLNRRLKRSNQRLEELLEMKSEFVGIVSHQLRTPLSALRGLLDMQVNGDLEDLPAEKAKSLQQDMLKSAVRLNELINDLMDMTKVEGGVSLDVSEMDLKKLVKDCMEQIKESFERKGLELDLHIVNEIPPIEADRKYIHEAITNLLDNAEKYTREGGVKIKLRRVISDVVITISDTGIGLTKEDKETLFQKFRRGHRSPTVYTEGTGLGLYIVKRIIDAHHGEIHFDSEGKGKGTTVTVKLPIHYEN